MELSSFWAFIKTRRQLIGTILLGVVLFLLGWQLGRAMSPYYDSRPIIFSDENCSNKAGGTLEELSALQRKGQALQSPAGESPSSQPKASVAAASAGIQEQTTKLFIGNKNSRLFHHRDCPTWQRIGLTNRVQFSTAEEATAAGYQPTQCTQQKISMNK